MAEGVEESVCAVPLADNDAVIEAVSVAVAVIVAVMVTVEVNEGVMLAVRDGVGDDVCVIVADNELDGLSAGRERDAVPLADALADGDELRVGSAELVNDADAPKLRLCVIVEVADTEPLGLPLEDILAVCD